MHHVKVYGGYNLHCNKEKKPQQLYHTRTHKFNQNEFQSLFFQIGIWEEWGVKQGEFAPFLQIYACVIFARSKCSENTPNSTRSYNLISQCLKWSKIFLKCILFYFLIYIIFIYNLYLTYIWSFCHLYQWNVIWLLL